MACMFRRASSSSKLLSFLQQPHYCSTNPLSLLSRVGSATAFDHSLKPPYLKYASRTHSHGFSTATQNPSQISSGQWEITKDIESVDEMLQAFKELESCSEEKDLGVPCLQIAHELDIEGKSPEQHLSFAQRALRIFEGHVDSGLSVAMALQSLGSACYKLSRFDECLEYLNRADRVLTELEGDSSYDDGYEVLLVLQKVQYDLFNVKTDMGRREDALHHLRKALEIKENPTLAIDIDSMELGNSYKFVAEAYVDVGNYKEALPFGLKALEKHESHLGRDSVEVVYDRRLLGEIYSGLGDKEKCVEHNKLSQEILKKLGREIEAADMEIALGRYEEAITTLKGVLNKTEKGSKDRSMAFTYIAKALCNQGKFTEAEKWLEIQREEKKDRNS